MKKRNTRFEVIHKEGSQLRESGQIQILVDKQTGVNYLMCNIGYGGGLTVLRDAQGNPVISPRSSYEQMDNMF